MAITKLNMPTVDKVIAGDVGTSLENPIDALIIGAGPSGKYLHLFNPKCKLAHEPRYHGIT